MENAIKGVDGVVAAEADLNEANVTVDFEAPATPEAIQAAVNGAGRYELSL
ncbi:heavy metal-associated domain protein [Segatella baroniae F0067]|uniref:Heavy metal-associated domain protein n=1 Tax=Segatella baroniae F0067 TaxID=1115809 RepID=U2QBN3_9BACT|nr:heavy metal-associated domain protein [Segatella baroniae F0067]